MKRYAMIIKIRAGALDEYVRLHKNVWPDVLEMIRKCNIRNYSIYHRDGYLFSYFEYIGEAFESDIDKMAADPKTQQWWSVVSPLQEPLKTRNKGQWWADMVEVFHVN